MDIKKTAREIGFFETALNAETVGITDALREKVETGFPLPSGGARAACEAAAQWLVKFNKQKYLFLTPEIALIEAMTSCTNRKLEAIIMIPCDMDQESEQRLQNNLPRSMSVHTLKEPYFPNEFLPMNSMIVACGHTAGEHLMVLPETYRMIEHYGGFMGRQVFVPYVELASAARYEGWIETSGGHFDTAITWADKYTYHVSNLQLMSPLLTKLNQAYPFM